MVSSYAVGIMGATSEYSRAQEAGYQQVQNEFGSLPHNCASLDKDLKRLAESILTQRKKSPLPNLQQKAYIDGLESKKRDWEVIWATRGCRDIIENIRLQSFAVTETSSAIKQEKSVLGTSNKNQNLYIGLGGLVMLVGLYIVLK
jgi:hypothetical protein